MIIPSKNEPQFRFLKSRGYTVMWPYSKSVITTWKILIGDYAWSLDKNVNFMIFSKILLFKGTLASSRITQNFLLVIKFWNWVRKLYITKKTKCLTSEKWQFQQKKIPTDRKKKP